MLRHVVCIVLGLTMIGIGVIFTETFLPPPEATTTPALAELSNPRNLLPEPIIDLSVGLAWGAIGVGFVAMWAAWWLGLAVGLRRYIRSIIHR